MDFLYEEYVELGELARGQTTVEYALILGVVVLVAILGFTGMGASVSSIASAIVQKL